MNSKAIFYSDDPAFCAPLLAVLGAHDWEVARASQTDDALAALEERVAVMLLDAQAEGAADLLALVRAQPQPGGGVPVLTCGAHLAGASALVAMEDPVPIAAIERFTGDLADHTLRRAPFSPFYRLVRLLGTRDAATMIDRFADSLRSTLAEGAATTPAAAHRLAGLAGAVGYTALAHAWRAAEQGNGDATDAAIAATHTTLAQIEGGDVARHRVNPD